MSNQVILSKIQLSWCAFLKDPVYFCKRASASAAVKLFVKKYDLMIIHPHFLKMPKPLHEGCQRHP